MQDDRNRRIGCLEMMIAALEPAGGPLKMTSGMIGANLSLYFVTLGAD